MCRGQFGIRNVYVGVPARLGAGGVVEIVDPGLSAAEVALLRAAADEVAARVADLDAFGGAAPPAADAGDEPAVAAPAGGVKDLVLASQIRTAARAALARQGRLDQLDEVVAAAMRRAGR
jgi:hypothetical protein